MNQTVIILKDGENLVKATKASKGAMHLSIANTKTGDRASIKLGERHVVRLLQVIASTL